MRYKNIIIKCKNPQEFIELQKHLFKLSYNWCDNRIRNRQIKKWRTYDCSILIKTDDRLRRPEHPYEFDPSICDCKVVDFTKLIRSEKLKKINEISLPR